MLKEKSFYGIRIFLDLMFIGFSFITAASLAISFEILLDRNYMFLLLLLMILTWYLSSNALRFYADSYSKNLSFQFINIIKMVLVQTLLSIVFVFIIKEEWFIRNFTLYYTIEMFFLVSLRTIIFSQIFQRLKQQGKFHRNLLIVGAGEIGINFSEMILSNQIPGYTVAGFVDNSVQSHDKINILGKIDDIEQIFVSYDIQEVILALPSNETAQIDKIIKACNNAVVRMHIVPDYFKFLSKRFHIGMFGNFPIITVRNEPLEEIHWRILKRTFDIVFSILIIILIASWLFTIIMLIQKLTSRGRILFIQDRFGKNKQVFKCYKFRTMKVSTDDSEYIPTLKGDPRVTKFGEFLRKTNLDETPQIFNVLLGKMSLVGPRPHPLAYHKFTKEFSDEIELRSLVKPGITGWAQVNGYRGDAVGEEESRNLIAKKIQYDLWYIENWSFWLDLQIIILTIWQMLQRKNQGN